MMSIGRLELDDRTYTDLVAELRALIPRHAPGWTSHNASDPGIMLVELFAWLAEALVYRTNRIPDASRMRFLELLGGRFSPARPGELELEISVAGLVSEIVIPRHSALSGTAPDGKRLGFRSRKDLSMRPDAPTGTLSLYQLERIEGEVLGTSDGRPFQSFALQQDWPVPKLEDAIPEDLDVSVGDTRWRRVPDLLSSRADDPHYCFEPLGSRLRFGDGVTGAVPPVGAEVRVDYYRTRGAQGRLPAGSRFEFVEDIGVALASPLVSALAVGGGGPPTPLEASRDQALALLEDRFRVVTSEDYEAVAREHRGVARAVCVPDQDLSGEADDPTGHVSIVLVPEGQGPKPQPSAELKAQVLALLEERRLLTTKLHVLSPDYHSIRVALEVVPARGVRDQQIGDRLIEALAALFDPLTGGEEGTGWPFGRDVYVSEVHQLLEGVAVVDHVERLVLEYLEDDLWQPADAGCIAVAEHELVHLESGLCTVRVAGAGIG